MWNPSTLAKPPKLSSTRSTIAAVADQFEKYTFALKGVLAEHATKPILVYF